MIIDMFAFMLLFTLISLVVWHFYQKPKLKKDLEKILKELLVEIQASVLRDLVESGKLTPNEVREYLGLPPVPNGNTKLFRSTNAQ